jgi:hemerythrin-like domain-containing protein
MLLVKPANLLTRDNDYMLRNENLVPLSHQHQHALALCVRIERAILAGDASLGAWQREIHEAFEREIEIHFEAEEQFMFPVAERYEELKQVVSQLLAEHTELRSYHLAAMARSMARSDLLDFVHVLSNHIRTEERELFERSQCLMSKEQLTAIGDSVREFFGAHGLSMEARKSTSAGERND